MAWHGIAAFDGVVCRSKAMIPLHESHELPNI
jgi:hypothetical protein